PAAQVRLGAALNLDLNVELDLSRVEGDGEVTEWDRVELCCPDRGQFFLEDGGLYAAFGYENLRPFFARRIGLNAPINFGARLSGKIDKDWRVSAMNMQTGSVDENGLPAQNFTVVGLQRRVFSRSSIGAIFINKQSLNYTPDPLSDHPEYSQFNRNLG